MSKSQNLHKRFAFILNIHKTKEQDAVIKLLSADEGLISIYARNILSPKSKRKSTMQPLNYVEFIARKSRVGNLETLSELNLISSFPAIKSDKNYFAEAFCLAESLLRLLPEETKEEKLFNLLAEMSELRIAGSSETLLGFILINVLDLLGYLPQLDICQTTNTKILPTQKIDLQLDGIGYRISAEYGEESEDLLRIAKIQKFFLHNRENLENIFKLKIDKSDIVRLNKINLLWIEFIAGREILSKKLLFKNK